MIVNSESAELRMVSTKSAGFGVGLPVQRQAGHSHDRVHGSADLMAHGRQKWLLARLAASASSFFLSRSAVRSATMASSSRWRDMSARPAISKPAQSRGSAGSFRPPGKSGTPPRRIDYKGNSKYVESCARAGSVATASNV